MGGGRGGARASGAEGDATGGPDGDRDKHRRWRGGCEGELRIGGGEKRRGEDRQIEWVVERLIDCIHRTTPPGGVSGVG